MMIWCGKRWQTTSEDMSLAVCRWILAPAKVMWEIFDIPKIPTFAVFCRILPYFASRCGWLNTYKKSYKSYKVEISRTPCRFMLGLPRIPNWQEQRNSGFAKLALIKRL